MVEELIQGAPGSAQAIIQKVSAAARLAPLLLQIANSNPWLLHLGAVLGRNAATAFGAPVGCNLRSRALPGSYSRLMTVPRDSRVVTA